MPPIDFTKFYNVRKAAAYLDVSTQRVYQMIERGDLIPTRSPHGILLDRDQVHRMKDERIYPKKEDPLPP
jgi:excisionase family DNA binding protein